MSLKINISGLDDDIVLRISARRLSSSPPRKKGRYNTEDEPYSDFLPRSHYDGVAVKSYYESEIDLTCFVREKRGL